MISEQVISISDLKIKPSTYINSLKEKGDKYIFVHNKPKAVLVDVNRFEKLLKMTENIWITDDENIVWSINNVFWWNEKEITFW